MACEKADAKLGWINNQWMHCLLSMHMEPHHQHNFVQTIIIWMPSVPYQHDIFLSILPAIC